ncbi:hypothetical protein RclHR1_03860016 [Rhizophagus clarus]|uniref:Serine-threonine/tyrosine-protein kinase catalytic domain-containing protein n=1 Tax=Rhizophagus clarus TaxID=94130 RepID=A0A2Z6REQ4_9GLOM|nr:hypothetical protein RclHR1_03860016 [Rhizophagus clarus]
MSEMNAWSKWIEEAVSKNHIKHYEYNNFKNIQEIGTGGFGKVYRTNEEIHNNFELQLEVTFHNNIINFYGVTISDYENQRYDIEKYLLAMEYVDGGSLNNYLKENFEKLTWDDKYKPAYQLSIKYSKIVEASTKKKKDLFGIVPYMGPKKFSNISYSLNDLYSVGVLSWEISKESSHGELSQMIQGFDKMNTKEIIGSMTSTSSSTNILPEYDLKQDHPLAQYFVGYCYTLGYGTIKNEKLAFEYYEKVAYIIKIVQWESSGLHLVIIMGMAFVKERKLAIYWYEKAANNGKRYSISKAIYWYRKAVEQGIGLNIT